MYFYEVGTRPGVLIKQDGMCPQLVYFPCPASDGKMGGAWERGWHAGCL